MVNPRRPRCRTSVWINFYVERVAMLAFNEAWKRRIPESGGFRRAWHWKTSNFALGVARRIKTKTKVSTCDGETQFDLFRNWNGIFTCVGLHQSTKQFLRLGRKKEKTTEWHRSLTLCRSDAFRRKMSQSIDSKQLLLVAEKWPAGRSLECLRKWKMRRWGTLRVSRTCNVVAVSCE